MSVEDAIQWAVRGVRDAIPESAEDQDVPGEPTERDSPDDPEEHESAAEQSSLDYDPEDLERRSDTMLVLGLEPETFAKRLVREHGGRIRQQDFTEYTNWSESTISRLLRELEEKGEIARVRLGREKIVFLPDERPTADGI